MCSASGVSCARQASTFLGQRVTFLSHHGKENQSKAVGTDTIIQTIKKNVDLCTQDLKEEGYELESRKSRENL